MNAMNIQYNQNTLFSFIYKQNRPVAQLILVQQAMFIIAFLMFLPTSLVWAGPGHDHGDAPAAATGSELPRVTSHSDLFELVGIVATGEMTIFLDRYATNEPVKDATIDIEIGDIKGVAAV